MIRVDLCSIYDWAGISVAEVRAGVCEITTPFVDRHNDSLQIYLFQENGNYVLTDDGYTLSNLEMSGSGDLLHALRAYQIQPVLWSQREQHVDALQL